MSERILWRPFDGDVVANPYPMYKRLRTEDPVHTAQTREVIISRYEDVRTILKSPAFQTGNRLEWLKRGISYLQKKDENLSAIYQAVNSFVLMLNPPQHTRIRTFISKAWTDRDVDEIIVNNINRVLGQLDQKKAFDLVGDYAAPLSVFTISDILGVDGSEHEHLKRLTIQMTKAVDLYPSLRDLVLLNDSAKSFIRFFREWVAAKAQNPDNGLLSKMIERNKNGDVTLTQDELISVAIFLFIAGQETVSSLIGNGIYQLVTHSDQLTFLRKNPDLINSAVEEILRYDSPVQLLGRIATEDVRIGEKIVSKGSSVTLVVGSANRDEAFFNDPDAFDITRRQNRHLSFGSGTHFCLGDWLGRRQAQLAIATFIDRFKKIAVTESGIRWNNNLAIRSRATLPVTIAS